MSDDIEKDSPNPEDLEKEEGEEDLADLEGEEEEEEEDLDKPLTKKDLLDFKKGITSQINSRFAQKRHENKSKNYQPKDPTKKDNPLDSRLSAIEESNAKRDYGYNHNLSPKEVDLVWKFSNGRPTAKTLEHPFVKGGLEQLRASSNLRNNISSGSGSPTFEVEGKKWEELSPQDKQKHFADKQKAILSSKRK